MLDKQTKDAIYATVKKRPHTVQELALLLDKSWLTVDKYVERLIEEGFIGVHTFRGGTRGALKIVYWNILPLAQSALQKRFSEQVLSGRGKFDFAPGDLAHFAKDKKAWYVADSKLFAKENFSNLKKRLVAANEEVLIFSGNLSFSAISDGKETILDVLRSLLRRGVSIKIMCRVELVDISQMKAVLALEQFESNGAKLSIRHAYQPLRAIVIDSCELSLKETKDPVDYYSHELSQKTNIIYIIHDAEWVEWARNMFLTLYRTGIDAKERIVEIEKITKQP
jgi:predicted transcriptional regulator